MSLVDTLGYTTSNNKWESLTNKDLLKHDLLLRIYTHKGECDWDQSLGSTIIDKIFQVKTEQLRLDILSELQEIFENEPRINLIDIQTTSIEKGWIFTCLISYLMVHLNLGNLTSLKIQPNNFQMVITHYKDY